MAVDNSEIADQLSLLSKLLDIHGEESEKAKAYAAAAFTIENLPQRLSKLSKEQIFKIRNIGEDVGEKVMEVLETGELQQTQNLLERTPQGVLEMLNIKGIGPKKVNVLWKQLNIEDLESLKEACIQKQLSKVKGFGEKTEQKILDAIQFKHASTGKFLYVAIESIAQDITEKLTAAFKNYKTELTGELKRQLEVISEISWVTTIPKNGLKNFLLKEIKGLKLKFEIFEETNDEIIFLGNGIICLHFYFTSNENFYHKFFETSSSEEFLSEWNNIAKTSGAAASEVDIFSKQKINHIPSYLREKKEIINIAKKRSFKHLIQPGDIKGLIHSHSNWSDGVNTIEKMAEVLIEKGFEYLVISDHSKAAFYAGGLSEEKIIKQHKYIDELNEQFHPFKIFKSIECDILSDGSLDYNDDVLASFDLVITSIHSNLQMNEEKAMKRLLGAITNPYTTILGHMTGRKLLQRTGYPVHHKTIIDACADHNVVIEINANPKRLDMEWRWIDYAIEKNVLLSINPDAHSTKEFDYIKYGVLVAQKGGLTKEQNLSSFSLKEFETFLQRVKKKKGIS